MDRDQQSQAGEPEAGEAGDETKKAAMLKARQEAAEERAAEGGYQ